MIDITKDIQSLTTFRRSSSEFLKQLKKTKRPVQDAEAYQRLLDSAARADDMEAIRRGLDDVAHGRTRTLKAVIDDMRREYGIPR
jgi:hypothetical protein